MANTAALQEAIDWARGDLERQYGVPFAKSTVRLHTGGTRSFNAVASDGTVVATVLNSSGATSGGKKPVGKLRYAIAELYYLSLVQSRHRLLVVTNADFLEYLSNEVAGALIDGIELVHLPLPPLLAGRVAEVTTAASEEMGR
ncbi:hypothetical protein ABZX12_36150 [Kribbella sp. NPDC003505]|uniref:hypothetical protein n=1 Tax=Kribbella sp. NPDC003505 TaxID=3154448 RepID=UPI0033BF2991